MPTLITPPESTTPPPVRDFRTLRGRRLDDLPSDVRTLAAAHRGETLEVRGLLGGAGDTAAMLRSGDHLICRGRTSQWVIVELPGRGEYAVHRHDARFVRVVRTAVTAEAQPNPR